MASFCVGRTQLFDFAPNVFGQLLDFFQIFYQFFRKLAVPDLLNLCWQRLRQRDHFICLLFKLGDIYRSLCALLWPRTGLTCYSVGYSHRWSLLTKSCSLRRKYSLRRTHPSERAAAFTESDDDTNQNNDSKDGNAE